jgi:hypothetical protein
LAAPQFFVNVPASQAAIGTHNNQILRTALGTHENHEKTVTNLDGTAQVHRFDSRFHNNGAAVVRVARPRLLNSGPFAVQALPHQTPIVVGGAAGSTPVISAARAGSATNIFQTPDGRIFAFSNGAQRIAPGQIFQTPDGRIFTTAVVNNEHNNINQQQQQNIQPVEPQGEIVSAVRDNVESRQPKSTETESEVIEVARDNNDSLFRDSDYNDYDEDSTEVPALEEENPAPIQRTPQDNPIQQNIQRDVVVTQNGAGLTRFVAVPHPATQILARAPLTPATSRFVPTQVADVINSNNVVSHDGNIIHAAAPSIVRAVATPFAAATPVAAPIAAPAITHGVPSTGFFTFPGAGIAFNF